MDILTLTTAKAYTNSQRLAYVGTEESAIFPETTITEWTFYEGGNYFYHQIKPPVSLTVGETYIVIWDGTRYKCKCWTNVRYPALGNGVRFSGRDCEIGNGEPFLIMDLTKHSSSAQRSLEADTDNAEPHTFAIYQEVETIHPIDQKYIPPMDSITLNGADGNQYKVSVNASGALVAEAIV